MVFTRELPWVDPLAAAMVWVGEPVWALLDSAGPVSERARWSYLAVDPFATMVSRDGRTWIDGRAVPADPFRALEILLARHRGAREALTAPFAAPFAGGAVGFFGYETGRFCDRQPAARAAATGVPECCFGFYDSVIAFDRTGRRVFLLCAALDLPERAPPAVRAERIAASLAALCPPADPLLPTHTWRAEMPEAAYRARVARVVGYIRAGDIFQANFTTRFSAPRGGIAAFDLYRALRRESPAPFAAFLACGDDFALASASPERFLRLDREGRVQTRPIKGTRPRRADPAADAAEARALVASAKDRAENLMIVDLLRNDLGRVAAIGSVAVPQLCGLESFASVHHLVSAIEARLRPGLGAVDLLRASFPGGSITGAPKIRAMEIIAELEPSRREAYCGTIAWIGFDGAMDSSIVIRTLMVGAEEIVAQAGGGIVADSDPAAEYAEMRVKIAPLLRVLGGTIT